MAAVLIGPTTKTTTTTTSRFQKVNPWKDIVNRHSKCFKTIPCFTQRSTRLSVRTIIIFSDHHFAQWSALWIRVSSLMRFRHEIFIRCSELHCLLKGFSGKSFVVCKVNKKASNKCHKRLKVYSHPQGRFETVAICSRAGKPRNLWAVQTLYLKLGFKYALIVRKYLIRSTCTVG
jgi:hypothetical protein